MAPKSLLRDPRAVSDIGELSTGSFREVIPDELPPGPVKRVLFCSGKVYWDLADERRKRGREDIALVRLEQLYPFPADQIEAVLARYADDAEVVWCQEEPQNQGAWPMMDEWMGELLGFRPPRYIGRPKAASPATGSKKKHVAQLERFLDEAMTLEDDG